MSLMIEKNQTQHLSDTSLQKISMLCRSSILDMLTSVNSSHLGCCFSIIDILVTLYHRVLDVTLIKQQAPDRDYFILSKGHGAAALYATLASVDLLPQHFLQNYHRGILAGHPIRAPHYGIEASTGSLGHGLSIGVGIALASRHAGYSNRIVVLVGDGECQEGSVWEAIIMASRLKLNNLTIIVDYNNLQGLDKSNDIMPGTLEEKFKAFGCNVTSVDGHHHADLINTLTLRDSNNTPQVIIAHTTKGKGIVSIEDKLEWHYRSFKSEAYIQAKKEVTKT